MQKVLFTNQTDFLSDFALAQSRCYGTFAINSKLVIKLLRISKLEENLLLFIRNG